jgi:hypothetical protein
MQKRIAFLLFTSALAVGKPSLAGVLPFEGTFQVAIASLPAFSLSGAGTASVTGTGSELAGITLPSGVFATLGASMPVTDDAAFPLAGVKASASNAAGSFSGSPLAGPMAVVGQATLCLFAACNDGPAANVVVPFTVGGTRGVGLGGGPISVGGLLSLTLQGAPWTSGTAMAGSASLQGFVHGPASGGAESAAAIGGVLQLVTPITIQTDLVAAPVLPAFGILTLQFVPEPGTLLLVAAGTAGLALLGRKRLLE